MNQPQKTIPYRIETGRLVLRCLQPEDASAFRRLLDESDRHLRPWIPWMKDEPRSLDQTLQRLREHRADFDLDRTWRHGVLVRGDEPLVGLAGLHDRVGPGALEVGYLLHPASAGKGYALEAAAALVRVAFELHHVDRIEIHCDPRNTPSAKLPAKLGFRHEATLARRCENSEGEVCDSMLWTLFRGNYATSPARKMPIVAFDALGRTLLRDS